MFNFRKVSTKELSNIQMDKPPAAKSKVPYKAILKDKAVLGVWSSVTGWNLGFLVLLLYGPTYLSKVDILILIKLILSWQPRNIVTF